MRKRYVVKISIHRGNWHTDQHSSSGRLRVQDENDPNHIKVGIIIGAEQQAAEIAQKVAKEKYGLDIELVTFNNYVLPN